MGKLALVVDDSAVIRRVVCTTLKAAGYETVDAANGDAALTVAKTQEFALVITDMNMPVMSGLELIRELRALANYRFTPIVFLTTETNDRLRAEALDAGATAWVVKPFQPEKILTVIQRIAA